MHQSLTAIAYPPPMKCYFPSERLVAWTSRSCEVWGLMTKNSSQIFLKANNNCLCETWVLHWKFTFVHGSSRFSPYFQAIFGLKASAPIASTGVVRGRGRLPHRSGGPGAIAGRCPLGLPPLASWYDPKKTGDTLDLFGVMTCHDQKKTPWLGEGETAGTHLQLLGGLWGGERSELEDEANGIGRGSWSSRRLRVWVLSV